MKTMLRCSAVIAVCSVLLWWPGSQAYGSEAQASDPSSAFSLTISPTRLAVDAAHLDTVQQVKVINYGKSPLTVNVAKRNFVGAPDGTMQFQDTAPYSASEWVTVSPMSFEVAPGATQIVSASIVVPPNPELGDHQVAFVFLVPSGTDAGNVKINRGIGVPVYLTVPGAIDDSVAVSDLVAPGFMTGGASDLTVKIRNVGTVHRDFRGPTALALTGAGSSAAFADFSVPRGAERDLATTWTAPFMCICHPTLSVTNANGTVSEVSVQVIVFPWPLLLAVVGAAAVVVFGIRFARRRYRSSVAAAAARLAGPGVVDA